MGICPWGNYWRVWPEAKADRYDSRDEGLATGSNGCTPIAEGGVGETEGGSSFGEMLQIDVGQM